MDPRKLLQALLDRDGETPTSLARRFPNGPTQPQIFKFLRGIAREPKRATLEPLAAHFSIPLDAFYSEEVAARIAQQLGLLGGVVVACEAGADAPTSTARIEAAIKWPFRKVSYKRVRALPREAIADIDANLDVLVERWERSGKSRKTKGQ